MIVCVTPNAAIDRTLVVPGFKTGTVVRPTSTIVAAGGKGMNVARAVHLLGGEAVCAGFLGGHTGRLVADLAAQEGLHAAWTWTSAETRTCVIIADPDSGESSGIYEPGTPVHPQDWEHLQTDLLKTAAGRRCVCFSGSLPPGSPPEIFAALVRALISAGSAVWADISGPPLEAALAAGGAHVKINHDEASDTLGRPIADPEAAAQACAEFRALGASSATITLGAAGAVMAHEAGTWWAQPPTLQVVSAVASGDSFLAGLVMALTTGHTPPEALSWAAAAGAANALSTGGARFTKADFDGILPRLELRRLR